MDIKSSYKVSEIVDIVGGVHIGVDGIVRNIIFDSRVAFDNVDILFVALKGELADGHQYINELISKGVKSFIVDNDFLVNSAPIDDVSYIVVENPLHALQLLAAHYRRSVSSTIVAITGSNGKSVVKEWIHQIFSDTALFRSPKSYNSQLGVALSLLLIPKTAELSIIEAGISMIGEMERLADMIAPEIVIVTNIGDAHGENFSSKEEKLREKLLLATNSRKIIVNNVVAGIIGADISRERLFVWGHGSGNDMEVLSIKNGHIEFFYNGTKYLLSSPFTDAASCENILHIIALAALLKMDLDTICRRVELIAQVPMRLEIMEGYGNIVIINDSYNSDFNSLSVALSHLKTMSVKGGRTVIISDIVGSGRKDEKLYTEVAALLDSSGVDEIIAIGERIGINLEGQVSGRLITYKTTESFLDNLTIGAFSNRTLLIKGCRSYGFERIVKRLQYKQHKSVIEVNIDALVHNYRYFRSLLPNKTKMVAMVKAMGYGSGYFEVALALQNSGADYLAVAYIDEGIILRERGITIPIIILNSNPYDYQKMIEHNLEPEIYNIRSLRLFIDRCRGEGVSDYPIHIKLDTGMHRMGFESDSIYDLRSMIDVSSEVTVSSIFSHFSSSDDITLDKETERQMELFNSMCNCLEQPNALRHISNSCGVVRFENAHFDMVRVGLGLYGISSFVQNKLHNVTSLHTNILQIKNIEAGEYVGYNMAQVVDRPTTVATLSIGYADGVDRRLGCGRWSVWVNGKRAKTLGNISMDTCAIDITDINASEGDRVTIYSNSDDICAMAELLDTIPYEILTSISTRIKRVYVRE